MESLVTSLELSKKLKELGVEQNGVFYWYERVNVPEYEIGLDNFYIEYCGDEKPSENHGDYCGRKLVCSAFTATELMGMMLWNIKRGESYYYLQLMKGNNEKYIASYESRHHLQIDDGKSYNTPQEALGLLLVHLKENKLV